MYLEIPGVNYRRDVNDKIQKFLEKKIKYAKEFVRESGFETEINNRVVYVAFIHPEEWPNRIYRLEVVYRLSDFRDPDEFYLTLQEAELV
ncbi:hypothetical protein EVB81_092 [Rhizobium phage RHph_I46]|uniref:Uncharacterized protein n=1 Tax=Rhizobium phage RHph_I1_9 TaxID=2509729 RepID=A0A7S5R9P3_9CAUD|nr:hypothetical protein PP936_gp091 [Rhizobium phage RHph_I1_9]QIG69661.1 hypothetical protein EVB81_092 [Rhizobium phage RHph_I46]QIG70942.1 hypothetical protein EVB92_092 [Rhizobium phage RHph_I9]QIG73528.1 hypothetical protein EVC04_091 [Rhizobium phage RHph_I1_9]QIG76281.1 hypothetical protein EVC25_092 [Rhizobium phage RHph_I34]